MLLLHQNCHIKFDNITYHILGIKWSKSSYRRSGECEIGPPPLCPEPPKPLEGKLGGPPLGSGSKPVSETIWWPLGDRALLSLPSWNPNGLPNLWVSWVLGKVVVVVVWRRLVLGLRSSLVVGVIRPVYWRLMMNDKMKHQFHKDHTGWLRIPHYKITLGLS